MATGEIQHKTETVPEKPYKAEETVEAISLGRLVRGFPLYFRTAKEIVTHPSVFAGQLYEHGDGVFWKAFEFVSYGILISFLLVVPTFIAHHMKLAKLTFFARFILQFALYGGLLHLALRIVGSNVRRMKSTLTAYFYFLGISVPTYFLVAFPFLLIQGPKGIFGTAKDVQDLSAQLIGNIGLLLYLGCALFVYGVCAWIAFLIWFSKSHQIGKIRVFFALFLAGLPLGVLQLYVINPVFNFIFGWVDRFLDYL
jgi:hypothetical protein